jgi:hypothetical protein
MSSQGGALITHRQTPDLAYSDVWKFIDSEATTPAVAVSPEKNVFASVRKINPRPLHAAMMQVMGGLFSGHNLKWRETEHRVVENLLAESEQYQEKPGKSQEYNEKRLREAASRIATILKACLEGEVAIYIRHFAARLSDRKVDLKLDRLKLMNNCQTFCMNLMHGPDDLFKTIIPKAKPVDTADDTAPRYLLSFASDQFGSVYDSQAFYTTPSAAYFAEFHTGEDIVEYFETWPSIPKANACAKLLCWPCQNDNNCSMSQHMWQMPHETTSIVLFHVLRDRASYRHDYITTDPKEDEPSLLTDDDWFQNRLRVLVGLDTFLVSTGAIAASYQTVAEVLASKGRPMPWRPASAKEVGALIRQGNEEEGTRNFTIYNVRKSIFPNWFSRDRRLEKHLAKTTTSRWRSGPGIAKENDDNL